MTSVPDHDIVNAEFIKTGVGAVIELITGALTTVTVTALTALLLLTPFNVLAAEA